ncbi:hypothetical protein MPK66_gp316 [Erwinia phage pEa_SNUABM_2]|uniref:Uncharacterized protein n=1 Tax=Erwinia phage pEa_SNUABM_2 TaxID=2869547 RepID=A0AAE8C1E1_9CAUD|nr:hypothetical protein MPK66_gp316 [Erwinia phage pEa_SNUABM_2]QZE59560.1 hypothetical protein pEaSNUABM2_00316 [Erwinia phage pEa_SNUABM_2]QZE59897.1 hypothetical protein pEaSNUABM39_00317 [Erwinia phage pEa_SNUABM_39]
MPTTSRPKTEDKFSRARAAKNSPERQAAAAKKTPRGPSSVRPKSTADREPKIRDEERVYNLVHAILSAWKADVGHAENTAASAGIIKVSRRKIEGALRDLKNTRFTKIPTLINDILTGSDICDEFGMWVYVEHDSPDWIFVRLPDNSTPVIRADISYEKTGERSASVTTSSEALMETFDDNEDEIEIEIFDCTESDIEDLEAAEMRKRLIDAKIINPEAAPKLSRNDLMKLCAYYSA